MMALITKSLFCNCPSPKALRCALQMMALIADFMLVWLPAPTLSFAGAQSSKSQGRFNRFMASCPDNAFQVRAIRPNASALSLSVPSKPQSRLQHFMGAWPHSAFRGEKWNG